MKNDIIYIDDKRFRIKLYPHKSSLFDNAIWFANATVMGELVQSSGETEEEAKGNLNKLIRGDLNK